jgi:hypothetical protein
VRPDPAGQPRSPDRRQEPTARVLPEGLAREELAQHGRERRRLDPEAVDDVARAVVGAIERAAETAREIELGSASRTSERRTPAAPAAMAWAASSGAGPDARITGLVLRDVTQEIERRLLPARAARLAAPQHDPGEAARRGTRIGDLEPGRPPGHGRRPLHEEHGAVARNVPAIEHADPRPRRHGRLRARREVDDGDGARLLDHRGEMRALGGNEAQDLCERHSSSRAATSEGRV